MVEAESGTGETVRGELKFEMIDMMGPKSQKQ